MIGRGPLRDLVEVAVLVVPLLFVFFMCIILSLFVCSVKLKGKSCGLIVDNSAERVDDRSECESTSDQRTHKENHDAEGRCELAHFLSEGTRSAAFRRVEPNGNAGCTLGVVRCGLGRSVAVRVLHALIIASRASLYTPWGHKSDYILTLF